MSTTLAKALSTKQKTDNLSIEALAKAIGVSAVSVRGALKGKSKPNKATASKYATFLGLSEADISGTSGKPAKAAKKAGKPAKKTKAGKKPGKAKAAKSAAKQPKGSAQVLGQTLQDAVRVLSDKLAVSIHQADKATRDLIGRILGV